MAVRLVAEPAVDHVTFGWQGTERLLIQTPVAVFCSMAAGDDVRKAEMAPPCGR
jgi:hypothetical protein